MKTLSYQTRISLKKPRLTAAQKLGPLPKADPHSMTHAEWMRHIVECARRAPPGELFRISVEAGIYSSNGKLMPEYGGDDYEVFWHEADQEWVARCPQYPGLSNLDKDKYQALAGLKQLIHDVNNGPTSCR